MSLDFVSDRIMSVPKPCSALCGGDDGNELAFYNATDVVMDTLKQLLLICEGFWMIQLSVLRLF